MQTGSVPRPLLAPASPFIKIVNEEQMHSRCKHQFPGLQHQKCSSAREGDQEAHREAAKSSSEYGRALRRCPTTVCTCDTHGSI